MNEELQEELNSYKDDIKNSEKEISDYKMYFAENMKNGLGDNMKRHLNGISEKEECNNKKNNFKRWLISLIERI